MILITGGTGTVGSHVVELLLDRGEAVRVLARDPHAARSKLGQRAEIAQGDFGDPDSLLAALRGADRLFLLTSRTTEPGTQLEHERALIAAATESGVRHVVKLSVLGADERSPISYARMHRDAERELEASGLARTILRAEAFMQNFFETVVEGAVHTCAQDGRVAMVDTRDIAAVAATILAAPERHEGKTYALTGPAGITFDEAARALSAATGRAIRHVRVPPEGFIEAMTSAGQPRWFSEDLAAQYGVFAAGRGEPPSGDVAAVTGREPRSLADFAREAFAGSHPGGAQAHDADMDRRAFLGGAAALGATACTMSPSSVNHCTSPVSASSTAATILVACTSRPTRLLAFAMAGSSSAIVGRRAG